jgi:hypothetical protein
MFFESDALYSYGHHFCIGEFVTNAKGELAVLMNTNTYSHSTAKHQSTARSAVRDGAARVFYIPFANNSGAEAYCGDRKDFLRESLREMLSEAQDTLAKAARARTYEAGHLQRVVNLTREVQSVSDFFKLGVSVPKSLNVTQEQLEAARARGAAAREAYEAKAGERAQARLERERVARELQRVQDATQFEQWRSGHASVRCPWSYGTDGNGSAYLRINNARNEVETSLGAFVSIEDARKAWRFVKLCKEQGREFATNGMRAHVGNFSIRAIYANGNAQVGCHFFTFERIAELARSAGWLDDNASDEVVTKGIEANA